MIANRGSEWAICAAAAGAGSESWSGTLIAPSNCIAKSATIHS